MVTITVLSHHHDEGAYRSTFTGKELHYELRDGGELMIFGKDEHDKSMGALFACSCWSNVTCSED